MTEKKCQLTEKLRNYVYRYGTELSDDKLKKMGTSLEEINENFSDMEDIAKSIFEQERTAFEEIFKEYDSSNSTSRNVPILSTRRLKLISRKGCNKACTKTTYQAKWLPACILPN